MSDKARELDAETLARIKDVLEGMPERIQTLTVGAMLAPVAFTSGWIKDPEMKYRAKFAIENSMKAAKEFISVCEKALGEFAKPEGEENERTGT